MIGEIRPKVQYKYRCPGSAPITSLYLGMCTFSCIRTTSRVSRAVQVEGTLGVGFHRAQLYQQHPLTDTGGGGGGTPVFGALNSSFSLQCSCSFSFHLVFFGSVRTGSVDTVGLAALALPLGPSGQC